MKITITIALIFLTLISLGATSQSWALDTHQQRLPDGPLPDDDIPPPTTGDVQYTCSTYTGPYGWVMTGRGDRSCYVYGTGYTHSYKFEPPKNNLKICSNGPNPPPKFYRMAIENASGLCGEYTGVDYWLYTIRDSNWLQGFDMCAEQPLPAYFINIDESLDRIPSYDMLITRRNKGTCYFNYAYSIGKVQVERIKHLSFNIVGPIDFRLFKLRVCTDQAFPAYAEFEVNSKVRDSNCDRFATDKTGESIVLVVDYKKICFDDYDNWIYSPNVHTTAKAICRV